jgi:hypothetical protein
MHNLKLDHFYTLRMINGHMANTDGPIKTFPLGGHQGFAALLARWAPADLRGFRRVHHPRVRHPVDSEEKQNLVAFLPVL